MKKKKLPTLCDACGYFEYASTGLVCPFRYTPKQRAKLKSCSEFRRFK